MSKLKQSSELSEQSEQIFSLDIGTRSVVGLILKPLKEKYKVVDCEVVEHEERSMLDGQIHDIVAVAKVIQQVKDRLEKKHGKLHKVAVAAAGRSLKTVRAVMEKDIQGMPLLTRDDILALELSAVQEAQARLTIEQQQEYADNQEAAAKSDQAENPYYCVGYSVVHQYLDGQVIGNLIDQRGKSASIEVIATFLPRVVVDSLLSALKRVGLEMSALTLEPIAAINVLIPATMRKLNIALVDIGAGTSDIAIAEHGTITAYGMVPTAGDEITEAISEALLLDFPAAEMLKRSLSNPAQNTFSVTDVLGFEQTLTREEIVQKIESSIDQLAEKISDQILMLNGKPPQAVMLIGGGSQTPGLTRIVAQKIGLPDNRVAVRGADALQNIIGKHRKIQGPEFVTPVGIAIAATRHPVKYTSVLVNNNTVRFFDLKDLTVGDALLHEGIDIKRLHGRPGLAMAVQVNGKLKMIPGSHGKAPVILLNGEPAHLDTPISEGDEITVQKGEDGEPASAKVLDLIQEVVTLDVTINGKPVSFSPILLVNGQKATLETPLQDKDELTVRLPRTLRELHEDEEVAATAGLDINLDDISRTYTYWLNGERKQVVWQKITLTINGREATPDSPVRPGDRIIIEQSEAKDQPTLEDVIPEEVLKGLATTVTFNNQTVMIRNDRAAIVMDGQEVRPSHPLRNGAKIRIPVDTKQGAIFSDVFRYVDVQADQPPGKKRLVIRVNDQPADFNTPIQTGDRLEMRWEE